MGKKAFITAVTFSLILAGILSAQAAKANPYFTHQLISPIQGSVPPIITVTDPRNSTVLKDTLISFNVSCPTPPQGKCFLSHIWYILDDKKTEVYHYMNDGGDNWTSLKHFNYSQNLNITDGNHTLVVKAETIFLPGSWTIYFLEGSSTVSFLVETTPTPSHSPSPVLNQTPPALSPTPTSIISSNPSPSRSPSVSPMQTPTLQPSPTPNKREDSFAPVAIVAGLVIAVVVVGLLVFFKKIKKTASQKRREIGV